MTKSSRSRYDDIWPRLEILFKGVLLNPDNSCETTEFQEEVYNDVQTLIINNEERQLYVDLKALLEVHLESNVCPKVLEEVNQFTFISTLNESWRQFSCASSKICNVLSYFHDHQSTMPTVKDKETIANMCAVSLFKRLVLENCDILVHLKAVIAETIQLGRQGKERNLDPYLTAFRMLQDFGTINNSQDYYLEVFENYFLDEAHTFYQAQVDLFLREGTAHPGLFIEKAEALFSAEVKRIEMFCPELTTQFKCKSLLHEVLVVKILKKICDDPESAFPVMLKQCDFIGIKKVYSLCKNVPNGIEELNTYLNSQMEVDGFDIVQSTDNSNEAGRIFVQKMVGLREKYFKILEICFLNDEVLKITIYYCLQLIFKNKPMAPKFIALYIDDLMKRGGDKSIALDTEIDKVIFISCFLPGQAKKQFNIYLKENLIERLLTHENSVGEFSIPVAEAMMENCRVQLGESILQMRPFLVSAFPSIPEMDNYTLPMREFVQSIFLQKHGERVYIAFRELLAHHCKSRLCPDAYVSLFPLCCAFNRSLMKGWDNHPEVFNELQKVVHDMDKTYISLTGSDDYSEILGNLLLDLVNRYRIGLTMKPFVMKVNALFLVHYGLGNRLNYKKGFEKKFLALSATYFKEESDGLMRIHSACEYMTVAEDFIRTELNYIDTHFADSFTHDKTRVILHNEMYISRAKSILEKEGSGLIHLLKNGQITDHLKTIYSAFVKIPGGLEALAECFSANDRRKSLALLSSPEPLASGASNFVKGLFYMNSSPPRYGLLGGMEGQPPPPGTPPPRGQVPVPGQQVQVNIRNVNIFNFHPPALPPPIVMIPPVMWPTPAQYYYGPGSYHQQQLQHGQAFFPPLPIGPPPQQLPQPPPPPPQLEEVVDLPAVVPPALIEQAAPPQPQHLPPPVRADVERYNTQHFFLGRRVVPGRDNRHAHYRNNPGMIGTVIGPCDEGKVWVQWSDGRLQHVRLGKGRNRPRYDALPAVEDEATIVNQALADLVHYLAGHLEVARAAERAAVIALHQQAAAPLPPVMDQEDNDDDRPPPRCSICLERPVDTILLNCRHLFCGECAARREFIRCPACREPIEERLRAFFL